MFGACLKEEGMAELVCQEVAGATARAPALSFLAAIARDHGAMPQALTLFRRAHARQLESVKMLLPVHRQRPLLIWVVLLHILKPCMLKVSCASLAEIQIWVADQNVLLAQGGGGCGAWRSWACAELHACPGDHAAVC